MTIGREYAYNEPMTFIEQIAAAGVVTVLVVVTGMALYGWLWLAGIIR